MLFTLIDLNKTRIPIFILINIENVENRKLFQRAPSPPDFPLLNYFGFTLLVASILKFIWVTGDPLLLSKG